MAARFAEAGYAVEILETLPGAPLPELPACDLVLACGGDGTVHHVVQALAQTQIPLGIVPVGTANALARNLQIPLDPLAAIERLLTCKPVRIPLGQIVTAMGTRSFIMMAGCGPDGALIHSLPAKEKARFGRAAYYAHAVRLFFTRRWPSFEVTWSEADGTPHRVSAIGMIASRVPDLGGAFAGLTHRSSLTSSKLRVQILKPPAQLSLAAWFGLTRARLPNPWLQTIEVEELHCRSTSSHPVYAQADGEPMGPLPFSLSIVPDALTLLMPE